MSKSIFKVLSVVAINVLSLCMSEAMVFGQKITKCQDVDGKWHYGSSNSYLCADSSQITTLNKSGIKVGSVAAVKTKEELEAERIEKEEKRKKLEKERKEKIERDRILMVYQTEEDIQRDRDSKIKSLQQKKHQHENYIEALGKRDKQLDKVRRETKSNSKKRKIDAEKKSIPLKIEKSKKRIVSLDAEVEAVNKRYDEINAFFKKHKK